MKKKLVTFMLCVFAAFTFAVGLAACGDNKSGASGGHKHTFDNGVCTGCGEYAQNVVTTEGLEYVELGSGAGDAMGWLVAGIGTVTATDIIIPKTHSGKQVYGIKENAFQNCSSITRVAIPSFAVSIGNQAFSGCTALTSVTIADGILRNIGYEAFKNCGSLTSITIPSSVASVGSDAFAGCGSLTINCVAAEKPSGWASDWNSSDRPVVWNCNKPAGGGQNPPSSDTGIGNGSGLKLNEAYIMWECVIEDGKKNCFIQKETDGGAEAGIIFNANGTFAMKRFNADGTTIAGPSGTYQINGNKVVCTVQGSESPEMDIIGNGKCISYTDRNANNHMIIFCLRGHKPNEFYDDVVLVDEANEIPQQ